MFAAFGRMDPPPKSADEAVAVWPYLVQKEFTLIDKLAGGLVVFVFRAPDIEYWRFDVAKGWPAPADVLVRSVARYGAPPTAVMVARIEIIDNREGLRITVTGEHGRRRTELTQVMNARTQTVGPLVPRALGKVYGPTWMGEGPTIGLEPVGHPGIREGSGEA